jgi:hypothetical protein
MGAREESEAFERMAMGGGGGGSGGVIERNTDAVDASFIIYAKPYLNGARRLSINPLDNRNHFNVLPT